MRWPDWWHWELDCENPHLLKRMLDRSFDEIDLRKMLAEPDLLKPDVIPGRWVVQTRHAGSAWEVIVEPDPQVELLVIVTAYPVV